MVVDLLKKNPIQVLSYKYCKIFKNTYFEEHLQMAASVLIIIKLVIECVCVCVCVFVCLFPSTIEASPD